MGVNTETTGQPKETISDCGKTSPKWEPLHHTHYPQDSAPDHLRERKKDSKNPRIAPNSRTEKVARIAANLSSGRDRASVHTNSQQLQLHAQDLHKSRPVKMLAWLEEC